MTGPELHTPRLLLRRWTAADRAPFAAMNADPRVMEFFPAPLDRAASDAFVDLIETSFTDRGYGLWALEREADAAFLGSVGLWYQNYRAPFTPAVEVGWRLATAAWGHGYATEAARAAVRFGFEELGLDGIVSTTSVPNLPSQAVMQRLGMTRDPGEDFDHPRVPDGHRLQRHVLYRLSRDEWTRQPRLS